MNTLATTLQHFLTAVPTEVMHFVVYTTPGTVLAYTLSFLFPILLVGSLGGFFDFGQCDALYNSQAEADSARATYAATERLRKAAHESRMATLDMDHQRRMSALRTAYRDQLS